MSQKIYDKEFKINAVKLYLANKGSKSINDIAKDLGVSRSGLGYWLKNYKGKGEASFVGSGNVVNQEVRDLKRELHLVKQERDILKKAVVIFSAPSNKGTNL
ncbi:transposase [Rickettsia endosymbiont of Orchestes rusci]|uniref:transposase n=1 Tax=Rickettsia endosymbiont of Orchestes rusci TaxID=3066250 RepID=UPI00313E19BE